MDWPHRHFELHVPCEAEQEEAREYVRTHELVRPNTSYLRAFCFAMAFFVVTVVLTASIYHLGLYVANKSALTSVLLPFMQKHPLVTRLVCGFTALSIMVCVSGRRAAIGAIRLYQHYAPENVRRRCLFKPTCSEYAILALEKYGLVKGLYMAYERLFVRCRGNIYMIDEP
jgi:putative component of membrane protein insertase Oxa1/YidC/SpoIIIJ protein YidD